MIKIRYEVYSENLEDYDPNDYISYYHGRIIIPDESTEDFEDLEIGEIRGYLININLARENNEDIYYIFDDYSEDFAHYYQVIFDRRTNDFREDLFKEPPIYEDILMIDDLIIYPKFRRNEYGLKAIMNVMKTFGMSCGLILIETLPLQHHSTENIDEFREKIGTELLFIDKETGIKKLKSYWSKLGFKPIKNSPLCMIETSIWQIKNYQKYYA